MVVVLSQIFRNLSIIIKKHGTLTKIPLIHAYIDRINNRLMFKMKDGYKLELQAPETMKIILALQKK